VYQERRALALSLSDTKTAVNKLHRILDVVLFVLVGIIWLLVLGVATQQLLVFVSSQLLLIVFIFGNTLKTIFEAIVFLFVMHPFDVGDRCVIDGVQVFHNPIHYTWYIRYYISFCIAIHLWFRGSKL
jgi:small-conductance mechanosensitive channel